MVTTRPAYDKWLATVEASRKRRDATYERLWREVRDELGKIDPALNDPMGEHYAHNWYVCADSDKSGRDAVVAILARYQHLRDLACKLDEQTCKAASHQEHIDENEAGRYLWCDACKVA